MAEGFARFFHMGDVSCGKAAHCGNQSGWYFSNKTGRYQPMYSVGSMSSGHESDLRNSLRFPLHLQVTLRTPSEEFHAKTIDISAGGVLFQTDASIRVDSPVEFTIEMPGEALGTDQPVLVRCRGRVVRTSNEPTRRTIAVVIDEYHFKRI
jgi:PilZ domain-containing protein